LDGGGTESNTCSGDGGTEVEGEYGLDSNSRGGTESNTCSGDGGTEGEGECGLDANSGGGQHMFRKRRD
jgi:hypothetical protein